ncbi:MAG: DUF4352 domain-containing protein [Halobacteriales archaeon]
MRRRTLLAATALGLTGCTSYAESSDEELGYGEAYLRPDDVEITVERPRTTEEISFGRQTFTPDHGARYLVVDVEVTNRSDSEGSTPPTGDFYAGEARRPVFSRGTRAMDRAYEDASLASGDTKRGTLVFDVELDARVGDSPVEYEHDMWPWSATWST